MLLIVHAVGIGTAVMLLASRMLYINNCSLCDGRNQSPITLLFFSIVQKFELVDLANVSKCEDLFVFMSFMLSNINESSHLKEIVTIKFISRCVNCTPI